MKIPSIRLASVLALVGAALAASAAPVTYTVSATGSGSLNGASFVDQLVTIVATGDTSSINVGSPLSMVPVTATVSVDGIGTDAFTQGLSAFVYHGGDNSAVGVGLTNYADILDVSSSSFASYDLSAPF